MSDTRNGPEGPDGKDAAANQNEAEMPLGGEAAPEEGEILQRLATAEAEAAEYKDRLLRALAEAENVRRRLQREREDAVRYAVAGFAKDLLSVADNLRRALDSVPEDETAEGLLKTLVEGVAATERELAAVFERHGLKRIDAKGERFDHNLHQAVFEVEDPAQPPGTVVQVLQPGYLLHDRLLRPAMVGVAKGGGAK